MLKHVIIKKTEKKSISIDFFEVISKLKEFLRIAKNRKVSIKKVVYEKISK